ncbi:hypothetical protein chiPu_0006060 [Chiloscyllium punctatum]|uniref:Uncharacterized protein n=2 Tax=Chiloscyllium punctatum TaxID=137246 RepID=A0A401SBB8_CHIPU|nr:hypothetical protein [Chiloscyllium punctatum]
MCAGIIRMILDLIFTPPACGSPDTRPVVVRDVHFLYFSLILCLLTLIVVVIISLLSKPPSPEQIAQLTWYTRHANQLEPHDQDDPVIVQGSDTTLTENITNEDLDFSLDGKRTMKAKALCVLLWCLGMEERQMHISFVDTQTRYIGSLYEEPRLRYVVNANLLLCVGAVIFLYSYFA